MPSFAHTAYVSPSGNDSTGTIDDSGLPFATAQAAYNAVYTAWSSDQTNYYLLQFAAGTYTQYGNINVNADWPEYIWIQGAGAGSTSINNITANNPASNLYDGNSGYSFTINSDASISVRNIAAGDGGYATDDGSAPFNLTGGNGGSVTLNSVVVIGYLSSGNGGSTDSPITSGAGTIGGNGGNVTINNSAVGANVNAGNGVAGGSTDFACSSGNGGGVYVNGQVSSTSYENTTFYAGNSADVFSTGGTDGVAGNGGNVEITGVTFSQAYSGSGGRGGYSAGYSGYVGVEDCNFYAIYGATGVTGDNYGASTNGGSVYVITSTGSYANAGNGAYPYNYYACNGGSVEISGSTIYVATAGNGSDGVSGDGGAGGSIYFDDSTCTGWLYAGNGGGINSNSSQAGNGGNIWVTNSTIPDKIYGGIGGANNYYLDPYLYGSGAFGFVRVDGGDQPFSYPATKPKFFSNNLSTANVGVIACWFDENENYAGAYPDNTCDIDVYGVMSFSGNPSYPITITAKSITLHGVSAIGIGVSCDEVTFKDSSLGFASNIYIDSSYYGLTYSSRFCGANIVNFYDSSGYEFNSQGGNPDFGAVCDTCNFYSNTALTNVFGYFYSVISNGLSTNFGNFANQYNFVSSGGSSGNPMISRLLNLPWFINI